MGKRRLGGVLDAIERGPLRSPLFHWMCEHHDEIAAAAAGKRLCWDALSARFAALGLTDRSGKVPSPETARQTWRRVRTYVARLRKDRAKAEASLFPTLRQVPPTAKPHPNNQPPITAPHSRQPAATNDGGSLAALGRALRQRSGRES